MEVFHNTCRISVLILTIFFTTFPFSYSTYAQKPVWKNLGPHQVPIDAGGGSANGIGRINAITFHPDYGKKNATIYACAPTAGLYRSDNNGKDWKKVETRLNLEGASELVFDASNPKVLYLASGDRDGVPNKFLPHGNTEFSQSNGVSVSKDGGKTWKSDHGNWNNDTAFWNYPSNKNITSIVSTTAGTFCSIYHLNFKISDFDSYVFKTSDKGRNWNLCLMTDSIMLREMIAMPGYDDILFAAGQKAYVSLSGGDAGTWTTIDLGSNRYSRIELAANKGKPGIIYLLASLERSGTVHLYTCDVKGNASFIKEFENLYSGEPRFRYVLESSNTSSELYFGNLNVHLIDSARNISPVSNWYAVPGSSSFVHADVHGLRCPPDSNVIYVGHDGGISRSRDRGKNWETISEGLDICKIYRISCSQLSSKILAGTQDAGTMLYDPEVKGENKWKTIRGGDGGACIIKRDNDSILIHSDGQNNVLALSRNAGVKWFSILPRGERGDFIKPLIQDPKDPNTIYAGFHDVYKSNDLGKTWNKISNIIETDPSLKLVTIDVSKANTDIIYAGYAGPTWSEEVNKILFATRDGGKTWKDVSRGLSGSQYTMLKALATDPIAPLTVFAGFGQAWEYKVMKSEDGGESWLNFSDGLPAESGINSLFIVGRNLYAATHTGVYVRNIDSGMRWKKFGKGLPLIPVYHLDYFEKERLLRAATNGRGVWECTLKP